MAIDLTLVIANLKGQQTRAKTIGAERDSLSGRDLVLQDRLKQTFKQIQQRGIQDVDSMTDDGLINKRESLAESIITRSEESAAKLTASEAALEAHKKAFA